MVQYRKPPQLSKDIIDRRRRGTGSPAIQASRLRAAQAQREWEAMMKEIALRQAAARVRLMRAARGR